MEWVGIGIAIAIGFYVAPFVLGAVIMVTAAILAGIASLFGVGR